MSHLPHGLLPDEVQEILLVAPVLKKKLQIPTQQDDENNTSRSKRFANNPFSILTDDEEGSDYSPSDDSDEDLVYDDVEERATTRLGRATFMKRPYEASGVTIAMQ